MTAPKWKDQAQARGITINIQTDLQKTPPMAGKGSELREVVTNLVLNAVDAMPRDGTITLRTRPDGEHVVLEVSDTGTGMSEEIRRRCMDPFFQRGGGGHIGREYGR